MKKILGCAGAVMAALFLCSSGAQAFFAASSTNNLQYCNDPSTGGCEFIIDGSGNVTLPTTAGTW